MTSTVGRHADAPTLLDRMADVLDGDDVVLAAPLRQERRRLRAAQQRAARARRRVQELRTANRQIGLLRWRRLLVTILALGVLTAVFVLAVMTLLFLLPGPLLVLPAALVLAGVVEVTRRLRGRAEADPVPDLDAATEEAAAAATAVRRARRRLSAGARRLRGEVALWCRHHGVPADARALRRLARQDERRRAA
ncbi:hypothetical protein ACQEVB_33765 [Pseudonocardia sp. CA-107938]|uniref:hypothetical protein n=1 Tax=Pseudonocardia sp. CA-107938 TaxID=3240021 RepID=UPI003D91BB6A